MRTLRITRRTYSSSWETGYLLFRAFWSPAATQPAVNLNTKIGNLFDYKRKEEICKKSICTRYPWEQVKERNPTMSLDKNQEIESRALVKRRGGLSTSEKQGFAMQTHTV
jgi:hypothetical protein